MTTKSETLDKLQALLNGEALAVHMFDTFIPEIEDEYLKESFQDIRSGHRQHIDLLSRRIEEMGRRPKIQPNLKMRMGEWMIDAKTRIGINRESMVRQALKGEDMGLTAAEEIYKEDMDEMSKELVGTLLSEYRIYVMEILDYMSKNKIDRG